MSVRTARAFSVVYRGIASPDLGGMGLGGVASVDGCHARRTCGTPDSAAPHRRCSRSATHRAVQAGELRRADAGVDIGALALAAALLQHAAALGVVLGALGVALGAPQVLARLVEADPVVSALGAVPDQPHVGLAGLHVHAARHDLALDVLALDHALHVDVGDAAVHDGLVEPALAVQGAALHVLPPALPELAVGAVLELVLPAVALRGALEVVMLEALRLSRLRSVAPQVLGNGQLQRNC